MTKIGVFLPNCNNGYIVSKASPATMPTYRFLRDITVEAEKLGFDQALSMVKFRGFGGVIEHWDHYAESMTLMAALAEATERIQLFATAGILSLHPQIAARMAAMIADVSQGRFGLNIVTGGWKPEYTQFHAWPHDYYVQRYEYAGEYARILQALWTTGRASSQSRLWPMDDCEALFRPRHHIPLVNAGTSTPGQDFTAKYCDYSFAFVPPEHLPGYVTSLDGRADTHCRKVKTLALFTVIFGETDADAAARVDTILAEADTIAIQRMVDIQSENTAKDGSAAKFLSGQSAREIAMLGTFMGFPVLAGTPERIADQINALVEASAPHGLMLIFEDYIAGMRLFTERVRPRLRDS